MDTPLSELLDPASPQKLMYSLYIVESLGMNKRTFNKPIIDSKGNDSYKEPWSDIFTQQGGLRHLFDIFMSGM